jgi:hypothetical protein
MAENIHSHKMPFHVWISPFVLFFMCIPIETMAVREIPDDNLAIPVQINLINCTTGVPSTGS